MTVEDCPQCGGDVQIPEEMLVNGVLTCSWCDTELIVRVRIVLPRPWRGTRRLLLGLTPRNTGLTRRTLRSDLAGETDNGESL